MYLRKIFAALLFLIPGSLLHAQFLTDGVRLSTEPLGLGSRAVAMGGTAISNANDFSALEWNPAALTLLKSDEANLSLFFKGHNSSAQYLGTSKDESITDFAINSFALSSAVPTTRGHLGYALSI